MGFLKDSVWAALILATAAVFALLPLTLADSTSGGFWAAWISGGATAAAVLVALGIERNAEIRRCNERKEAAAESLRHTQSIVEAVLNAMELIRWRLYDGGRKRATGDNLMASLASAAEASDLCREAPIGKLSSKEAKDFIRLRVALSDMIAFVRMEVGVPRPEPFGLARSVIRYTSAAVTYANTLQMGPHRACLVRLHRPGPPDVYERFDDTEEAMRWMRTEVFKVRGEVESIKWVAVYRSLDGSTIAQWSDSESCWLVHADYPELAALPQRQVDTVNQAKYTTEFDSSRVTGYGVSDA